MSDAEETPIEQPGSTEEQEDLTTETDGHQPDHSKEFENGDHEAGSSEANLNTSEEINNDSPTEKLTMLDSEESPLLHPGSPEEQEDLTTETNDHQADHSNEFENVDQEAGSTEANLSTSEVVDNDSPSEKLKMSDAEESPLQHPGSPEEQEDTTTETNGHQPDHSEEFEDVDQEAGSRKTNLSTSEKIDNDSPSEKVAKLAAEDIYVKIICDTRAKALENIKNEKSRHHSTKAFEFHIKVEVTEDLSLYTIPASVETLLSQDPETNVVVIVLPQDDLRQTSIPLSCKINHCRDKGTQHILPLPVTFLAMYMDTLKSTREELMNTYPDTEFYWVPPAPVLFRYLNNKEIENIHGHNTTTDLMWKSVDINYNRMLKVIYEEIPGNMKIDWFTVRPFYNKFHKRRLAPSPKSIHQDEISILVGNIRDGENLTAKGSKNLWFKIREKIHFNKIKSQRRDSTKEEETMVNNGQTLKKHGVKTTIIGDSWIQILSEIDRWYPDPENRINVKAYPDLTLDSVIEKVDEVLSEETDTENLVLSVFQNDISSGLSVEYVENDIIACTYSTVEEILGKAFIIDKYIKKTYSQVKVFWVAPGPVGYYSGEEEKVEDNSNKQEKEKEKVEDNSSKQIKEMEEMEDNTNTQEKDEEKMEDNTNTQEKDEEKMEDNSNKQEKEEEEVEDNSSKQKKEMEKMEGNTNAQELEEEKVEDNSSKQEKEEMKEDDTEEREGKSDNEEYKDKEEKTNLGKSKNESENIEKEEKQEDPKLKRLRRACSSCNAIAMFLSKRLQFCFKKQVIDWFAVFISNRSFQTGPDISYNPELEGQILVGNVVKHGFMDEDFVNLSELGGIILRRLIIKTLSGEPRLSKESDDYGSLDINRSVGEMSGHIDDGRRRDGMGRTTLSEEKSFSIKFNDHGFPEIKRKRIDGMGGHMDGGRGSGRGRGGSGKKDGGGRKDGGMGRTALSGAPLSGEQSFRAEFIDDESPEIKRRKFNKNRRGRKDDGMGRTTLSEEKHSSLELDDYGSPEVKRRRVDGMLGQMDGGMGRGKGSSRGGVGGRNVGDRKDGGMGKGYSGKRLPWDGQGGGQQDFSGQQGGRNKKGQHKRFQGQDTHTVKNHEHARNNRRGDNSGENDQFVEPWASNANSGYFDTEKTPLSRESDLRESLEINRRVDGMAGHMDGERGRDRGSGNVKGGGSHQKIQGQIIHTIINYEHAVSNQRGDNWGENDQFMDSWTSNDNLGYYDSGETHLSRESNDHGSLDINRRVDVMSDHMDSGRGKGSSRGRRGGRKKNDGGKKNNGMGRRLIDKRLSWDGQGGGQHDLSGQHGGRNKKGQHQRFQGQDTHTIINHEHGASNQRDNNWSENNMFVDPWASNDNSGYYDPGETPLSRDFNDHGLPEINRKRKLNKNRNSGKGQGGRGAKGGGGRKDGGMGKKFISGKTIFNRESDGHGYPEFNRRVDVIGDHLDSGRGRGSGSGRGGGVGGRNVGGRNVGGDRKDGRDRKNDRGSKYDDMVITIHSEKKTLGREYDGHGSPGFNRRRVDGMGGHIDGGMGRGSNRSGGKSGGGGRKRWWHGKKSH